MPFFKRSWTFRIKRFLFQFLYFPVELSAPQILAGLMNDDAAKTDERQKVRDGHESIHAVGKVPHQRQIDNAAHKDAHDVDHAIEKHPALALEILDTTLAIIAPAKGCAEGEGGETEGELRYTESC